MIITLAGHVDHGKTSLVRAITGTDTDRLAEEKARGLTIDLGFAYLESNNLGFVDVPGHHRFIHNMVAGVAEHQFALLVVAADDGPMPQTVEHLHILTLLGIRQGAIALTKCDLVDDEHANASEEAVRQLTANTFLADAPIFRVAATSDPKSAEPLTAHLTSQAREHQAMQDTDHLFRMPVDRSFNIKGSGTVVTGTVLAGQVKIDDAFHVFPGGDACRVRSIRTNGAPAEVANVGDRTALNLSGIGVAQAPRGTWIADSVAATSQVCVKLEVLSDFPRTVRHWTPVHIYHGTSHTTGRLAVIDGTSLAPGSEGLVDLECDEPILACAGDRLLVRDQSLDLTLGGGTVRDTRPHGPRRRLTARLERLKALDTDQPETAFDNLLEVAEVDLTAFATLWGMREFDPSTQRTDLKMIDGQALPNGRWEAWQAEALAFVSSKLANTPNLQGLRESELPKTLPTQFRGNVLRALIADGKLAHTSGLFHLPHHSATLTEAQAELLESVQQHLNSTQPPSVGDLAKLTGRPLHQLTRAMAELGKLKVLDQINDTRYYLPEVLDEIALTVIALAEASPFSVKHFRDTTGIGRNVAIDVLEHFDRKGFTKRQNNERIVIGRWRTQN